MMLDKKINQNVWWVLQEIKKESIATPSDEYVRFEPGRDDNLQPDMKEQRRALKFLEKKGAIKIAREHYPLGMPTLGANLYNLKPITYFLDILQPRFEELFREYENSNAPQKKFSGNLNELCFDPITRSIESGKLPYIKDELFYSLWKYANSNRLVGKRLISFMDIVPLRPSGDVERFAIFEFLNHLKVYKVELENISFQEDIYKKYCKSEHEIITEYTKKHPATNFSKAIKKLFRNQATFNDVYDIFGVFGELIHFKLKINGLLEFVEFSANPTKKNILPLTNQINEYLQCFMQDKLFSPELKNSYKFARQKEIFLDQIKNEVRDYGLDFIFRQGDTVSIRKGSIASIGKDESYLFIHTLAALEKQGLFEVERIFITDMEIPPEEQTDDYKVKILASKKLLGEYKQDTSPTLISSESEQEQEIDEEEDCFSYDDGITTPYENSDSELFILKTILLYHKQRDDAGFLAKELSYDNDSIEEICKVINRLIEDKILYLSANTRPERLDEKGIEGIEAKSGFINWELC